MQRSEKEKQFARMKDQVAFQESKMLELQQRINALEPTLLSEKETQEHFQRVIGAQGNFTKLKDLVEQRKKLKHSISKLYVNSGNVKFARIYKKRPRPCASRAPRTRSHCTHRAGESTCGNASARRTLPCVRLARSPRTCSTSSQCAKPGNNKKSARKRRDAKI